MVTWKKIRDDVRDVRRPRGNRMVRTEVWKRCRKEIALVSAPRRPQYIPFNMVKSGGIEREFHSKEAAEKFVRKLKRVM